MRPDIPPRERQVALLLLKGCDMKEISAELKMKPRTLKANFNRLYMRYGIISGIKRVKLAVALYREEYRDTSWQQP